MRFSRFIIPAMVLGLALFAGPSQLAFGATLTEAQVDAILALLKTWWAPADLEVQEDISRRYQEALDKQNAE